MIDQIMTEYYDDIEVLLTSVDHNVSRLIGDRGIIDKMPLLIDDYLFKDRSMINRVIGKDKFTISTHMNIIELCKNLLERYDIRTADEALYYFLKHKFIMFFGEDKLKITHAKKYFVIEHFLVYFNLSKVIGELKVEVDGNEFVTSNGIMYYVNKYKHKSVFELTQMLHPYYWSVLDFIYKREVENEHNV